MARTKASVGAKVSSGKSSKARCSAAPPSTSNGSSGSDKSSRNYSGGNPVCPRETPKWQKPITSFFINQASPTEHSDGASSSKSVPKRNIIYSDDEDDQTTDKEIQSTEKVALDNEQESQVYGESPPKNRELDESITLEPLTGENSHKLPEYYHKDQKGKDSKERERTDVKGNNNNIRSFKRCSEDIESPSAKKIKVN